MRLKSIPIEIKEHEFELKSYSDIEITTTNVISLKETLSAEFDQFFFDNFSNIKFHTLQTNIKCLINVTKEPSDNQKERILFNQRKKLIEKGLERPFKLPEDFQICDQVKSLE